MEKNDVMTKLHKNKPYGVVELGHFAEVMIKHNAHIGRVAEELETSAEQVVKIWLILPNCIGGKALQKKIEREAGPIKRKDY